MATNRIFAGSDRTMKLPTASGLLSGAPYAVGQIPVVLLTDAEAASPYYATCQILDGVFDLSVKGTTGSDSAVAVGDIIYYTSGNTPKLDKTTTGVRFGYALEAIGSGLTDTINVKLGY